MNESLEDILSKYPRPFITEGELAFFLTGTPDSRYGKVKRLLAKGRLLHIRRGLYGIATKITATQFHPYALAQPIYAPSYVSLESALNYHGLIPEAVYTVTNACAKRSKEFHTPLGIFSYQRLPLENFYTEVDLISENDNAFFLAKPWKAICDYVFCYKKDWQGLAPLIESLRIDAEDLPILSAETSALLEEYYQQRRIKRFLQGVKLDQLQRYQYK